MSRCVSRIAKYANVRIANNAITDVTRNGGEKFEVSKRIKAGYGLRKGFLLLYYYAGHVAMRDVRKERYYRIKEKDHTGIISRVRALRRRVSVRRDKSRGMHLMREASTAKVLRDTAIKDRKNEIQFAQAAAATPLFDADLRCKMKNEITRAEELVSLSLSFSSSLPKVNLRGSAN